MYFSTTFVKSTATGDLNTYDTWHLIPKERPSIAPPPMKTNTIDIPGANGLLDLSTSLTGYPVYENRTGSIEYIVENDHGHWQDIYTDIMDTLHGKTCMAIMEEDPAYYYTGVWTVNQWKSDKHYSTITLDYNLYPYKFRRWGVNDSWLWDPFNFETGIVTRRDPIDFSAVINTSSDWVEVFDSANVQRPIADGNYTPEVIGTMPVIPEITIDNNDTPITIRYNNKELDIDMEVVLDTGTFAITDFLITNVSTSNVVSFYAKGHGTVRIYFTPGRL